MKGSVHQNQQVHLTQSTHACHFSRFYFSRFWDIVLGGSRIVRVVWNLTIQNQSYIGHIQVSLFLSHVFPSPARVKAKWTHTGWLAIRTTVCRMTVWFAAGIPIWPERRRRWQAVRSLWAMWVELVQFSKCLPELAICLLSVVQIILFWFP